MRSRGVGALQTSGIVCVDVGKRKRRCFCLHMLCKKKKKASKEHEGLKDALSFTRLAALKRQRKVSRAAGSEGTHDRVV